MTAKKIADVALDWCTDDNLSYEEEQKHESEDVVIPAIGQFTLANQQFKCRGTSVMKNLMHVQEYLVLSWLQALLLMTDHFTTKYVVFRSTTNPVVFQTLATMYE